MNTQTIPDSDRLQSLIHDAVETTPVGKKRREALSKIKWVLAREDGQMIRQIESHYLPVCFTNESEYAQVFDGRDNEKTKQRFFQALTRTQLFIVLCPAES